MELESDIISGDIGSVRNNLARLVRNDVQDIVSISQSSYSQNMLTVIIIYVPKSKESVDKTEKIPSPCGCNGNCQCKS
jgi:hypothetical protein